MLPNTASGEISLSKTEKYFKGEMSVFAECLEELGPELMEGRGRERDPNRRAQRWDRRPPSRRGAALGAKRLSGR